MALDPLKFKIAIERGNIKQELADVKKELTAGLKDIPISFKISNLESIKQQLQNLEVKVNISGTSDQKKQVSNIKESVSELEKLLAMQEKVQAALDKMGGLKSSSKLVEGFTDAERKLQEFSDKLSKVDGSNAQAIKNMAAEWKTLGAAITDVTKKQEKANAAKFNLTTQQGKSLNQAKTALADVDILIGKLEKKSASASSLGIDVTEINKRIAALKYYQELLDKIAQGSIKTKNLKDFLGGDFPSTMKHAKDELRKLEKAIKEEEKALSQAEKAAGKHASAMSSGASAVRQMTAEEQRLASTIQNTITQLNHQSQVLNDLKSMAFQYLSVYGAQQFLNNIIEIGGQLEMQRLSIGAILQNTAQANDLFDKIKGLALQSPFGVVELDQFTKQLSAYGFQYNELFDMTKRLADISAGAGTDVSRLALALGHVRAEGALTGYTLRQFAMNNIPMLGKLSEKLSELEGRTVTASEVRKRVSKKEVDYAMVESVIKELTNEGGMFYNMQETISQSVKAKWKNLRDAFDIMYGEMAESAVGGTLKDTATILTAMAKRWKELGTVILNVAKAYGAYKAYMLVYNVLLGQQARAVFTSIAAQRQAKVAHLQLASSYRALTASEQGYLLTSTRVSLADKIRMITNRQSAATIRERIALTQRAQIAELSMAITTRKLGAEELSRAVALGKVNKNVALLAIGNSRLHATQKAQMQATVASVRTYGILTGVVNGTAMAFTRMGAALKGLLMNPATWIFALIAGLTDLWQRNNQEMEKARDVSKALAERAQESVRNIQAMMSETGMSYKRDGKEAEWNLTPGGTVSHTPSSQMDGDAMIQTMEKWEEFIKNYSSLSNTLLQNALFDGDKLRSVTDQYDRLAEATETVMKSQQALAQIAEKAQFVIDSTNGGYLDDDIITNMDNYAKKVRASDAAISKFSMNHKAALAAVVNAAKGNEKFAAAINEANKAMQERQGRNLTDEEQLKELIKLPEQYEVAIRRAEAALSDLGSKEAMKAFSIVRKSGEGESSAYDNLFADMQTASDAIRQSVKEAWHKDIDELEDYEKQALLQMLIDIASKSGESTQQIKDHVLEIWAPMLKLPIDLNDVDVYVRMSQLEEQLNQLMGGPEGEGWPIKMTGVVDTRSFIQKVREAYKSAQDTITDAGPILVKMGITLEQAKIMTPEQIEQAAAGDVILKQALEDINKAYKALNAAETASKRYGFDLEDHTKSGKVLKAPKPKKQGNGGHKEDAEAKQWRERIRLLRDARSWYDKWEKEIGHTAALERVQEMFKDLVTKDEIKTLEDYGKAVEKVIAQAKARKAKNKGKDEHADEVIRQGEDIKAELKLMQFQRDSQTEMSKMTKEVNNLARQWDIFNNVLNETGDRMLALKLAGLFDRSSERNAAESLRANIEGMPGGDLIDFDEVMTMTDDEIEKNVKDMLGTSDQYATHIDAIIAGLKEWRKLSEDVMKQDIQNYAKLIGSAKDYWSLIMRNNSEYDDVVRMLNANLALGLIDGSGYMKGIQMAQADRDDKNSKLSANYINLMNNANALSRGEMLDAVENAVMHLEERMKAGLLTTEEYVNELMKLKDIRTEWEDGGFFGGRGAFASVMKGGNQGLLNYYQQRYRRYTTDAAQARNNDDYGEYTSAKRQADRYLKLYENLKELTNTVDDVTAVMQSLQTGFEFLGDFFDSLGMSGASNAMKDVGGVLGGTLSGASALSGLGPYGQIAGGALGLVSSMAQLGDQRRERQIEELKEEVHQIGNTLDLIRTARERELGYSRGSYSRGMAGQYASAGMRMSIDPITKKVTYQNASAAAMGAYYGGAGGSYEQELELLQEQREKYMKMYDEEYGKKKKSNDALEEYKRQIAELDDQIKYFSEDLANELWSIDLKGWADQIGDALMNAFENGTSAVEAFKDATRSIMQSVVSEMLKMGFMEPMFEALRERLFGKNGAFNLNDPKSSMGEVLSELGRFFGEGGEGQQMILASQEFLTGAEELLNKNFGMSLKDSSKATQTSGIQSQATEESIGILSGQMARIAQDVSVKRIFMTQIATEQMPRLLENAQMQRTLLESQFQSVRAIEHMMSDGDGALYASIDRMSRKIDRAITPEGRMRIE